MPSSNARSSTKRLSFSASAPRLSHVVRSRPDSTTSAGTTAFSPSSPIFSRRKSVAAGHSFGRPSMSFASPTNVATPAATASRKNPLVQKGTVLAAAAFRRNAQTESVQALAPARAVSCESRGWRVLRRQWNDFMHRRDEGPPVDKTGTDAAGGWATGGAAAASRQWPNRPTLSKEDFERQMDKLSLPLGDESPRELRRMEPWMRARKVYYETNTALEDVGWQQPPAPPSSSSKGIRMRGAAAGAEAFFPAEWRGVLTDELLAELIVDVMIGPFCDELLDDWADTVEHGSNEGDSTARPPLEKPRAIIQPWEQRASPHVGMSVGGDLEISPSRTLRLAGCLSSTPTKRPLEGAGFATRSPAPGPGGGGGSSAWNSTRFHASANAPGFLEQVRKTAAAQRPRQRLQRQPEVVGAPKWSFPMSASNFPQQWEKTTAKSSKPRRELPRLHDPEEEKPWEPPQWHLDVDEDGNTRFPYALAVHKAFIRAQPEELQQQALQYAPLNFTNTWS